MSYGPYFVTLQKLSVPVAQFGERRVIRPTIIGPHGGPLFPEDSTLFGSLSELACLELATYLNDAYQRGMEACDK